MQSKIRMVLLLLCLAVSVEAREFGHAHALAHARGGWHGDIGHFQEHDFPRWRGGRWYHGLHEARMGWWWVVGPVWYFYPGPVYPYPDPYVPPTAVVRRPGRYWYYCVSAADFYPYVPVCPEGWRMVQP